MSRIKGKNTKPEMLVRKYLFAKGFRYKLHDKKLAGKPDIILPKYKTIIFVHGCFWHSHEGCRYFVVPKTNTEWWLNKLSLNKKKDKQNVEFLASTGWNILTVWECELKSKTKQETLSRIEQELWKNLERYQ